MVFFILVTTMAWLWNSLFVLVFLTVAEYVVYGQEDSPCIVALRRYPGPDATYTAKHLFMNCPELCRNSTGRYPTGQFPHPWDCNAFINCYNDDAWVAWCQTALYFNQNNMQCDYPRNVNCSSQPSQFSVAPGMTTQSQWEYISTTPNPLYPSPITDVDPNVPTVTCKDSIIKLNEKEHLGPRPDLCKQNTGRYPAPDCRYYVQCTGINAAVARCPGGFVFDPVGSQCDWPNKNPKCLQSCFESGNFDKPKNPTPTPSVTPQPFLTTTIDPDIRTANLSCNESHCVPKAGCQAELCKEPRGQFEIIGNCSKFANCWENCAYITDCSDNLVFTDLKGACDLPFNLPKDHRCYSSPYSGGQNAVQSDAVSSSNTGSTLPAGAEQDQDNGGDVNNNGNSGYTFAPFTPLKFPSFPMNQMQGTGPGSMIQAQW